MITKNTNYIIYVYKEKCYLRQCLSQDCLRLPFYIYIYIYETMEQKTLKDN